MHQLSAVIFIVGRDVAEGPDRTPRGSSTLWILSGPCKRKNSVKSLKLTSSQSFLLEMFLIQERSRRMCLRLGLSEG